MIALLAVVLDRRLSKLLLELFCESFPVIFLYYSSSSEVAAGLLCDRPGLVKSLLLGVQSFCNEKLDSSKL